MDKLKVLQLLTENARMSAKEIAARADGSPEEAESAIRELVASDVIRGFTTVLNEDALELNKVRALIEVRVQPSREGGFDPVARRIAKFPEVIDLCLVSGGYDLQLTVEGDSLQDVARFVASKLSTIEGVLSTSTLFLLKKYKTSGKILNDDEEYERLKVCP